MLDSPVLRDEQFDQRLRRDGFVVMPALGAPELRALNRAFRELRPPALDGFHSTLYSPDERYKRGVDERLRAIVGDTLEGLLIDHEILLANFVTKGRGSEGAMRPHQDWSFVDERVAASLNVWCPLRRVDERNGAVALLRGGHRLPFTVRGSNIGSALEDIKQQSQHYLDIQPMRPGEVLVHDHRVIHASPPNRRRRVRAAAAFAMLPRSAQPLHFVRNDRTHLIERHRVDREFFLTYTFGDERMPACTQLDGEIQFVNPELTEGDLGRVSGVRA